MHVGLASDYLRMIATPDLEVEQINRELLAAGMQVQTLQPGVATMEDVFMCLTPETMPNI